MAVLEPKKAKISTGIYLEADVVERVKSLAKENQLSFSATAEQLLRIGIEQLEEAPGA